MHGGQPQAGLPMRLGGEERLEKMLPTLVVQARPRIPGLQHRVRTVLTLAPERGIVCRRVARRDAERPALRHRLARIGRQLENDLPYLRGVRHHGRHILAQIRKKLDIRPQHLCESRPHVFNQLVELHRAGLQRRSSAVG